VKPQVNGAQDPNKVPVRQRGKQKQARSLKVLGTIAWFFVVVCSLVAGSIYGWIGRSKTAVDLLANLNTTPKEAFGKDSMNLLILGCDEELAPGGKKVLKKAGRADMIMLAHLDFKNKTITGISVPRDTRTKLPGEENHKINAYHNLAKPSEADAKQEEAVEFLTGVEVDRTIVIDYAAFQEMVDAVGGVKVNVKSAMKYTDVAGGLYIDFKPGPIVLNGYDAMCYVRFRKADSDFMRTERQRQFLISFKSAVVKNWINLPEIIEKGVKVLGSEITTREVAALANFAKGVPQTSIKMTRMPTKRGRGSFEEIKQPESDQMFKSFGFMGPENVPTTTKNKSESE
jgi:polyisoprenyl-teichoic acid--peptidoglycan teichoic acid transferase